MIVGPCRLLFAVCVVCCLSCIVADVVVWCCCLLSLYVADVWCCMLLLFGVSRWLLLVVGVARCLL